MFERVVAIAGVARSGTSWLGEILNSSPDVAYRFQPLFSYAFKDRVGIDSDPDAYREFLRELYASSDPFLLQSEKRREGILPTFEKFEAPKCLVMKNARYHYLLVRFLHYCGNLKILAIVRNPCAALASWMSNPREFPNGSDPLSEWRLGACKNQARPENFFGFYKWRESTRIFLDLEDQAPDRVRVLRYEDLVDSPMDTARDLFEFVGLEFGEQSQRFLLESATRHNQNPYSVYKDRSVRDRWRGNLDPRIVRDIEQELRGTALERFLS